MNKLETDRLILRNFEDKDFNDFWEYYSQPLVREAAGLSSVDNSTKRWARFRMVMRDVERYAIVFKPANKLVGEIQLSYPLKYSSIPQDFEGKDVREMSYMLNQSFHRRGIMTEGVRAVLKESFTQEQLDGIYLNCFARNLASLKVALHCGFRYVSDEKFEIDHTNFTIFSLAITREQYLQQAKAFEEAKALEEAKTLQEIKTNTSKNLDNRNLV